MWSLFVLKRRCKMVYIIKLVNVHFKDETGEHVVKFRTLYDGTSGKKSYAVSYGNKDEWQNTSKEEGNVIFERIKSGYNNVKVLTIIDKYGNQITWHRVSDHYEVRIGGKFYCSCQSIGEVKEEIDKLKENEVGVEK